MTDPHDERPGVSTFPDHQIIRPVHKLARAVARLSLPDDDPVGRAEAALDRLSHEFPAWMTIECDRLAEARDAIRADGFDKARTDALFRAAHDIKGDAATFGYPLVAPVARSLCMLVEYTPDPARIPIMLIDQHVDAIRAIMREYAMPHIDHVVSTLTHRLYAVTQEFLVHENRHRPGFIDHLFEQSAPSAPA